MNKLKNLPISRKVILLALIPSIGYLAITGNLVHTDVTKISKDTSYRARFEDISLISDFIKQTQIERCLTAVYINVSIPENLELLNVQRAKADLEWEKALSFEESNPLLREFSNLKPLLASVIANRDEVYPGMKLSERLESYTSTIDQLMFTQGRAGNNTTKRLQIISQNNLIFQEAREASGLLRANLSGTFARKKPIPVERLVLVQGLFVRKNNALDSKLLRLNPETSQKLNEIRTGILWKYASDAVKTLAQKYRFGIFGLDVATTLKNTSDVVNDIGGLIALNLTDAK